MAATETFDPNAYLAQKKTGQASDGFDPNAYVAAKTANPSVQAKALPQQEAPDWFHSDLPLPIGAGGVVNVNPAGVLNAAKDMGAEGGGIALGQAAGSPLAEFGGVQAGGAIGGFLGSLVAQATNFADPNSHFSLGRAIANGATGMIPGSFLAKPGVSVAKKALAMGAANVGATNLQSLVDEGKPASLTQDAVAGGAGALAPVVGDALNKGATAARTANAAGRAAEAKETLELGRKLGLGVPPAVTRPGPINNSLQSLAGKAATAQAQMEINAPKIDEAIMNELGLPKDAELSLKSMTTAKAGPNTVYAKVAAADPAAPGLIEKWKQANSDASSAWAQYKSTLDPSLKDAALAAEAQADQFHSALKSVVPKSMIKELDGARVQLSKIGLATRALNKGGTGFDPAVIGAEFDANPEKLTGNFATIGRFENAFGKYVRAASQIPPSGVDHLRMMGKLGLLATGSALRNPELAVGGPLAVMAAEKGARSMILSPAYQRAFASPYYGSTAPDFASTLAKFSTMAAGRKN